MKRANLGRSLLTGDEFTVHLEALPPRFCIRDLRRPTLDPALRGTLRRWYLLGGAGVLAALLVWLGF